MEHVCGWTDGMQLVHINCFKVYTHSEKRKTERKNRIKWHVDCGPMAIWTSQVKIYFSEGVAVDGGTLNLSTICQHLTFYGFDKYATIQETICIIADCKGINHGKLSIRNSTAWRHKRLMSHRYFYLSLYPLQFTRKLVSVRRNLVSIYAMRHHNGLRFAQRESRFYGRLVPVALTAA